MLEPGQRVGDYEIEGELGGGGMARVYRARHAFLETHHAVKVLDPRFRVEPAARQRFLEEAKIQAKHLDHPNIVKVTGIVATEEVAALVMELVEGGNLEAHIAALTAPPSAASVREIMRGVIDAIGHAHAKGIIHRDLKPANILLQRTGGRLTPKVTDFGIAKVLDATARGKAATAAEAKMGTLGYMSPEQIRRAREVTPASDVFALGAVLYELATGKPAFLTGDADSDYDVMERIVRGGYLPPETRHPGIDPVIAAAIRGALEPDPARRLATAGALAAALEGTGPVTPAAPLAKPVAAVTAPVSPHPRGGVPTWVAGLVGVVAVGLVGWHFVTHRRGGDGGGTRSLAADGSVGRVSAGEDTPAFPSILQRDGKTPSFVSFAIGSSPVKGDRDAKLTLVEFCDFQDPHCADLKPTLDRLQAKYGRDLRVVWKNYPLEEMHPSSRVAALAALAAGRQGWFWLMHDALFANRTMLDSGGIDGAARAVAGLDLGRWSTDRGSPEVTSQLELDLSLAKQLELDSIPTVVIDGRVVVGAKPYEVFENLCDQALVRASQRLASGTTPFGLWAEITRAPW